MYDKLHYQADDDYYGPFYCLQRWMRLGGKFSQGVDWSKHCIHIVRD